MRLFTRLLVLVASLALLALADDDLSTKISSKINEFSGLIVEHYYLTNDMENASPDDAEVVLLRTSKNDLYVTYDQGKNFKQVLEGEDIIAIYPNPHFKNRVYFLTPDEKVFFTVDKGESFKSFRTPAPPNQRGLQLMTFDRNNKEAFIWAGSEGCEDELSPRCKTVTYYTNNNGGRWTEVGNGAIMCQYVNQLKDQKRNNLMYCLFEYNDGGVKKSRLAYSTDNFRNQKVTHENVLDFALAEEFLVVAVINDEDETLECQTSVDGETFSVARFPPDFKVPKQLAYTVLQSTTHAIFLHVTVSGKANAEYGAILKSNSYGTSFMLSLPEVNRNRVGFVDFEKMANLEGVAVSNIVINARQASRGSRKQLKSMITHNDGGQWSYLTPPPSDTEGKAYACSGQSLEKCSLNLHGFTERKDYRDTYTSASAVGMMIGVGNVGEYLEGYLDGNTYLTVDGGITWREIKKGAFMWEYGDQGSILVIVDGEEPTNEVFFSLDEGVTWNPYKFSEDLVKVDDISTVPNDNSRRFLLTGKSPRSKGEQSTTVHIDFSGLTDRQCKLDESNPDKDDYELWSPRNPTQQTNCLFGHETQYYRKLVDAKCYVGKQLIQPHKIVQDCECTREDYECDFNYVRDRDGTCKLVNGASPPDHAQQCKENPNLVEYYVSTGYRKIPLSTCKGGQELDKGEAIPCPGKKGEFNKKHGGGLGVIGTFFVIIVPIAMACIIGFMVFQHYQSKFGVIRLGDEDSFASSSSNPVVQQALKGLAYVVAGVTMIPEALKGLGEFARGILGHSGSSNRPWSRDYAPVDINEDDELLGDDIESDAEEVI
ncbi:Vacuolar protein sorting/targeting protein 10 [Yarrowia sp. B02]|nr:Vacuolar protein sorting/targeting protein 10 [Yarrowia sp. B02]